MENENKSLNKIKIIVCSIIVFLIIFLMFFNVIENKIKKSSKVPDLTILFNNELITLKENAKIEDNGLVYFSKEDIQNLFDKYIYFNEADNQIITTGFTHVGVFNVDSSQYLLNDETKILTGNVLYEQGIVYLPISDLEELYDIEFYYFKDINRIIIDSTLKEKKQALITKKVNVSEKKGNIFNGDTLEKLIIGEKINVIEESGKFVKIRTEKGNIGYISNNSISKVNVVRENYQKEELNVAIYKNYSNTSGVYDNIQDVDTSKLNLVFPKMFYVNKTEGLVDRANINSATYSIYKSWADNNSLTIVPSVLNDDSVSNSLYNYDKRANVINNLRNVVSEYGFIGININFSTIDDLNSFYRFIYELSAKFKEKNLKVFVTLNKNNIDKSKISDYVDYIIDN